MTVTLQGVGEFAGLAMLVSAALGGIAQVIWSIRRRP